MKKAQSRKREPFRIYRASITVEAALLYPILIFSVSYTHLTLPTKSSV